MRPRSKPGVERLAVLRSHGQDIKCLSISSLLPVIGYRGAAAICLPPQVRAAITLVDGQRECVTTLLQFYGSGRILVPGYRAIEAICTVCRADLVGIRPTAFYEIGKRLGLAREALAGIRVHRLERCIAGPCGCARCRLVCGENINGCSAGCRRNYRCRQHNKDAEDVAHDSLRDNTCQLAARN